MSSVSRSLALGLRGARNYLSGRPLCASFEITRNCNALCRHCHLGGRAGEEVRAAPETYGRICRELTPVVAQVSGGEPLLRRDAEHVVRALRGRTFPYIVLTTNGALLSFDRYAGLSEAGVDEVSLSFDYPDERHDAFRGIPGLFGRIRDFVARAGRTRGARLTLSCVIQSDNFRDMLRAAELARSWGVGLNFSTYTWMRTEDRSLMISSDDVGELRETIERVMAFKKAHGTIFTSDYVLRRIPDYFARGSFPGCRAGQRFIVVNPDATFSPCGLIIRDYATFADMQREFVRTNACTSCYTSSRANSEKPMLRAGLDNILRA